MGLELCKFLWEIYNTRYLESPYFPDGHLVQLVPPPYLPSSQGKHAAHDFPPTVNPLKEATRKFTDAGVGT